MKQVLCVAILALSALPAASRAACPDAPDHAAAIAQTLSRIQAAPREMDARPLSNRLWEYWTDAPDEVAQELLDAGMRARESYDYLRAHDSFDRLVAYCPDYAEGYNQRAFVSFLTQDFAAALPDLEKAIALSPNHVAAISGKALTLMGLGRDAEAQEVLREAVALNPWLSERHLLKEPPGKDI